MVFAFLKYIRAVGGDRFLKGLQLENIYSFFLSGISMSLITVFDCSKATCFTIISIP